MQVPKLRKWAGVSIRAREINSRRKTRTRIKSHVDEGVARKLPKKMDHQEEAALWSQ
jgi:hypothetical protein